MDEEGPSWTAQEPSKKHLRKEVNAMSKRKIIRAWKDKKYRRSLTDTERAQLPDSPAGLIELTESESQAIAGGIANGWTGKMTCCVSCQSHHVCPSGGYSGGYSGGNSGGYW